MPEPNTEKPALGNSAKSLRLAACLAIPVALLMFAGLFLPVPHLGRELGVFFDMMHGPAFALFAALLVLAIPKRTPRQAKLVAAAVWVFIVGGGICSEVIQGFLSRSASWHDIAANSLGATAGVLWAATRSSASRRVRRRSAAVAVFLICAAAARVPLALADCFIQRWERPLLASFERPLEMIRWAPYRGTLSRVAAHATHGRFSLRMETNKEDYYGVAGRCLWSDWSDHESLEFDLTVVEKTLPAKPQNAAQVQFIVRLQDESHTCDRSDRYERTFRLAPGVHKIKIPLTEVASAPQGRKMNLARMGSSHFILIDPGRSFTLYLDNIRLSGKQ